MSKQLINVLNVSNSNGDWYTLYINGKRMCHGHDICADKIVDVLKALGDYEIESYEYKEITDECQEIYDGEYLPEDINIMSLQFKDFNND